MTPKRPRRASVDPRFESFAIQVEAGPGKKTRAVVEKVVREELGEGWRIEPLDEPSGEYDVSRKARERRAVPLPSTNTVTKPSSAIACCWCL